MVNNYVAKKENDDVYMHHINVNVVEGGGKDVYTIFIMPLSDIDNISTSIFTTFGSPITPVEDQYLWYKIPNWHLGRKKIGSNVQVQNSPEGSVVTRLFRYWTLELWIPYPIYEMYKIEISILKKKIAEKIHLDISLIYIGSNFFNLHVYSNEFLLFADFQIVSSSL